MKEFLKKNKSLLSKFSRTDCEGNLLAEAVHPNPHWQHTDYMNVLMLHSALKLTPIFLYSKYFDKQIAQSYIPSASCFDAKEITVGRKRVRRMLVTLFPALLMACLRRSLPNLKYDGVVYGDIVYDRYLNLNKVSTFNPFKFKVLKGLLDIYLNIALEHDGIKGIIERNNIKSVYVSHMVGSAGILLRCALSKGLKGYFGPGIWHNQLHLVRDMSECYYDSLYDKSFKLNRIMALENFDLKFEELYKKHMNGEVSADACKAYSSDYNLYTCREEFSKFYKLDVSKKNVFVMMHAFIDHPHSHFKSMLFNDYGDWFYKTLDFAMKNNHVNWFFKRHPSDEYYKVVDVDYKRLFENAPSHVHFIDIVDSFDTRNLGVVADAVITCAGSAGFEMPAFFGIHVICAGNSHYHEFDFAFRPADKHEYFLSLKKLDKVQKICSDKQKMAKAFYLLNYYYSYVKYPFMPKMNNFEHFWSIVDNKEQYYQSLCELYDSELECIEKNIGGFISEISNKNFKQLHCKIG